ncbi:hypothetical protein [Streptomyces sp. NPDC126503]|uniref:hypothetical protein n=1 Tax=Streptomyces sp. NPDC126503 TaxID=3155315 RepID=UPI00331BDE9A
MTEAAALPEAVVEDPFRAAVMGGSLDDAVRARAAAVRIADLLPRRPSLPPVVSPDASPVFMAALMERTGSPEVLVVAYDDRPQVLGTVDAVRLLHHYFPAELRTSGTAPPPPCRGAPCAGCAEHPTGRARHTGPSGQGT